MDAQEKIKENYAKNLKAEEYLAEMEVAWSKVPELFRFMIGNMNEVFQTGKFKGSKLLDIGSGATVHSIAAASAYFPNIVLSDYVEDNVEQLKLWLEGKKNVKQFLDIPAELEGYGNDLEAGRKVLKDRIRRTVKQVGRCDVTVDGILLFNPISAEVAPPFDVIMSCLCLEVAPKDVEGYFDICKRISTLLRSGGGVLVCGFLQGSPWKIKDNEFHHVQLTEEDVRNALTQAGFVKIDMRTLSIDNGKDEYKTIDNGKDEYKKFDYTGMYFVTAEKI